jgi:PAS domain S-box-containing protein
LAKVVAPAAALAGLIAAGWVGLRLATLHGNISAVWPATGMAIWILIRFGPAFWPAVAGAVLAVEIFFAHLPPLTAALAAGGATLEALAGEWLWRRGRDFWPGAPGEAVGCLVAALVAPVASATTGAAAMSLAGSAFAAPLPHLWLTWWTGDAIGALILLPVLLALPEFARAARGATPRDAGKGALLLALTATTSWLAFGLSGGGAFLFSVFPLLLLATVWFDAVGARAVALFIAVAGVTGEFAGRELFSGGSVTSNLLNLQVFLATVAAAALLLPLFRARGNLLLPAIVLLVGWSLTGWIYATLERAGRQRQQEIFAERVAAAEASIQVRITTYIDALRGSAAFFAAAKTVGRDDWRAYAESLHLAARYPGMNGIGVIYPVRPEETSAWLDRMRANGVTDLNIRPFPATTETASDVKYVITLVEPFERNRVSIGRNIATEPSRRLAAEQGRDTGEPRMNRRIPGSRDAQRRSGFLLYVPLYQKGAAIGTVAERRAAHLGWIYAQFFSDNFLNGVLGPMSDTLQLHFFEDGALTRDHLLFASGAAGTPDPATPAIIGRGPLPAFALVTTMEMAGQRFQLGWRRGAKYIAGDQSQLPWVAGGFSLTTLLLAGLVMNLQSTGQRARALAAERTEELAAARHRLQAVLDGTTFSVIATTPAGLIEVFNAGAERMLGYAAAEMVGRQDPVILHLPEEVAARATELGAQFGRHIAPGFEVLVAPARLKKADEREWTYVRKDGSRLPVLLSVTALRGVNGDITGYLSIGRDITARRQAEEERAALAGLLRRTGEMAKVGGWEFDLTTFQLVWSLETCRIHEVDPPVAPPLEQAIAYYAPEARPVIEAAVREGMARGTPWDLELPLITATGRHIWVRAQGSAVMRDGKAVKLFGAFQDITERRQAVAELRASEERFRALAQHAPAGIFQTDAQGSCIYVNERWTALAGLTAAEAAGDGWSAALHPEDRAAVFAEWQAFGRGDREFAMEYRFLHRDGRVLWVAGTAVAFRDAAGATLGYLGTVSDISPRKELEANLALARDAALESSRLKSEFLATMSHEIRTPMNAVIGMAGLLAETRLHPEQQEMVRTITAGAEHLLAIVNDILDFSRIEAGRVRLDPTAFELAGVVEEVVALLAPRAREKSVALTCDFHSAPRQPLFGDAGRVRQVLTNLIGNAIKFTPVGTVSVAVRTVSESDRHVRVRLEVSDTGVGIPPEVQPRLFQPFTQADGSTTRKFGGTGLGLAISRQLVELMGGKIGFASNPGEGSQFWFELTFAHHRAEAAPAVERSVASASGHRGGGGRRLLLAEDNSGNQRVATLLLEKMGYIVEVAADGELALARLRARRFDALLADCQMPELDGYETARRIRSGAISGVDPQLPIIALTAYARSEDRARCLGAGMNDYVAKPIRVAELQAALIRCGLWDEGPAGIPAVSDLPPEAPRSEAVLDDGVLQSTRELLGDAAETLLREVSTIYLGDETKQLEQLERLAAERNGVALGDTAHSLSGNAAVFGGMQVRRTALDLEAAARANDWTAVPARLAELRAACTRLREELARRNLASA